MRLVLLWVGEKFSMYALDVSGRQGVEDCPAKAFLADLRATDPAAEKALMAVMTQHANRGRSGNIQKSRALGDDLYEFKTQQGARLLYFYAPGGRTILSHGFKKGEKLEEHMKRAASWRAAWQEEQRGKAARR